MRCQTAGPLKLPPAFLHTYDPDLGFLFEEGILRAPYSLNELARPKAQITDLHRVVVLRANFAQTG